MAKHVDVAIVGGGLAGIAAARRLMQCDVDFHLFEAAPSLGGRARTDNIEGFKLDHGFQILLPAYPEATRVLDYDALDLRSFTSGAMIRHNGKFHRVADPRREPFTAIRSAFGPIGTIRDKLRLVKTAARLRNYDPAKTYNSETSTLDWLQREGYSERMIDRLFRPFFAGVCFDNALETTSQFTRFVMKCFAQGGGAVPAQGIQAIPDQLASNLPKARISLNSAVQSVEKGTVTTTDESMDARCIILATDMTTTNRLLQKPDERKWNGSVTFYYTSNTRPISEPILYLNAEGKGHINNVVSMSEVSPYYAPEGQSLIAVSLPMMRDQNIHDLQKQIETELLTWFGNEVNNWRLLKAYHIPQSLPEQSVGRLTPWHRPTRIEPGLYVCGDHQDNASIDGALTSGFRTAQFVMDDLHRKLA